jgi:hypothetical protein
MIAFAYYLLKVVICSGVLFIYYHLALRNKLFHQWNRFYLLAAVAVSLLAPVVQISIVQYNAEQPNKAIQMLQVFQSADGYMDEIIIQGHRSLSAEQWIVIAYAVISLILFVALLTALIKVYSIIHSHTVTWIQNIKFINARAKGTPFSFFRYIFWNEKIDLQTETGQQIFQHELVHVREKHTLDKLFLQMTLVFFWCNPFFWLIRRELKLIHEFIADKKAVGEHGTAALAAMILSASYPAQFNSITNQFFQTSIKRRLAMLAKIGNTKVNYIARILALPIITVTVLAFTLRTKNVAPQIKTEKQTVLNTSQNKNKPDTIPRISGWIKVKDARAVKTEDGKFTLESNEIVFNSLNSLSGRHPMVIVNGKRVLLSSLEGKEIYSKKITAYKENMQEAIAKYGEDAKSGVLIFEDAKIKKATNKNLFDTIPKKEPIFSKAEFEAKVNKDEWTNFLRSHLQSFIEDAASKGIPPNTYTVKLRFIVRKDGTLSDFQALNDPGYGIGKKVIEIMRDSPKWEPAQQNGHPVNSYHTQPITFVIQDQGNDGNSTSKIPKVSVDELKRWSQLNIENIVSFELVCLNVQGTDFIHHQNLGGKLDATSKEMLEAQKPGNIFTLEKIIVNEDGKEIKRPALMYYVTE